MGAHTLRYDNTSGGTVSAVKAIVQVLAAVLAAVVPALTSGHLDAVGWFNVIALAAGAVMVYNAANLPGWPAAKLIASAVAAVAVALMSAWQGGITTTEIIQIVLAGLGALGVYALPNAGRVVVQ
jgi:hypothetical protein